MLVATIPVVNRISAKRMLPRIPARIAFRIAHASQLRPSFVVRAEDRSNMANKATALANKTQRITGVMVMAAVICRKDAMIPTMILEISEKMMHVDL